MIFYNSNEEVTTDLNSANNVVLTNSEYFTLFLVMKFAEDKIRNILMNFLQSQSAVPNTWCPVYPEWAKVISDILTHKAALDEEENSIRKEAEKATYKLAMRDGNRAEIVKV